MSELDEIKARVEASMCTTYGSAHPEGRVEARITREDFDALLVMLTPPQPVVDAVERILDEHSAWISRPSREVTERVAFAATVAAFEAINPSGITH